MPPAGLDVVGWKAATTRPWTETSRSRSPRTTVAIRTFDRSIERSVLIHRLNDGATKAMIRSDTTKRVAARRSFFASGRLVLIGWSIAEESWIIRASLTPPSLAIALPARPARFKPL